MKMTGLWVKNFSKIISDIVSLAVTTKMSFDVYSILFHETSVVKWTVREAQHLIYCGLCNGVARASLLNPWGTINSQSVSCSSFKAFFIFATHLGGQNLPCLANIEKVLSCNDMNSMAQNFIIATMHFLYFIRVTSLASYWWNRPEEYG